MQMMIKFKAYVALTRLDRPIGSLLLLWPTLWALWLASAGPPAWRTGLIFIAGVVLMRSAGCAINDFADRKIDGFVARTAQRPLALGLIRPYEAVLLAAILAGLAFLLVLRCQPFTIALAVIGFFLALIYPFTKRWIHTPQFILGLAFAWGIPMAFAEVQGSIPDAAWILYASVLLWTLVYDTMYAMVDRADDQKLGVKSTAILLGHWDRIVLASLQCIVLGLMLLIGHLFKLSLIYYCSIVCVAFLFAYQQVLIKTRHPKDCFKAFMNHNWVGLIIFIGIAWSLN